MFELENLSVSINGIPILRRVTFEVGQGETVAFVGRNGAGKTTTLRAVMGLVPSEGDIRLAGSDVREMDAYLRPGMGIGYAPEDRRLFTAFSVEQNILMPAKIAKMSRAETGRRLDRVYEILPELLELAGRSAGAVSGGQGKMVALGRALMIGTRLVLLDEPFQGLAPVLARRYAEAIAVLREREPDLSIIITESNPSLVEKFSDRTITIERGEIATTCEGGRHELRRQ